MDWRLWGRGCDKLQKSSVTGVLGVLRFRDTKESEFFGVWVFMMRNRVWILRSPSFLSFRHTRASEQHDSTRSPFPFPPRLRPLRRPHRFDSESWVLFTNLSINLSLVTIVWKPHFWKFGKNLYFGKNKWFLLGSAGSAVPRSAVPKICDTLLFNASTVSRVLSSVHYVCSYKIVSKTPSW